MKSIITVVITSLLTLPVFAKTSTPPKLFFGDFCNYVFQACSAKDFKRDDTAPAGKKIWNDCMSHIIEDKKAVEGVDINLASFEVSNCRNYLTAKSKFDAQWAKNNKVPKAKTTTK